MNSVAAAVASSLSLGDKESVPMASLVALGRDGQPTLGFFLGSSQDATQPSQFHHLTGGYFSGHSAPWSTPPAPVDSWKTQADACHKSACGLGTYESFGTRLPPLKRLSLARRELEDNGLERGCSPLLNYVCAYWDALTALGEEYIEAMGSKMSEDANFRGLQYCACNGLAGNHPQLLIHHAMNDNPLPYADIDVTAIRHAILASEFFRQLLKHGTVYFSSEIDCGKCQEMKIGRHRNRYPAEVGHLVAQASQTNVKEHDLISSMMKIANEEPPIPILYAMYDAIRECHPSDAQKHFHTFGRFMHRLICRGGSEGDLLRADPRHPADWAKRAAHIANNYSKQPLNWQRHAAEVNLALAVRAWAHTLTHRQAEMVIASVHLDNAEMKATSELLRPTPHDDLTLRILYKRSLVFKHAFWFFDLMSSPYKQFEPNCEICGLVPFDDNQLSVVNIAKDIVLVSSSPPTRTRRLLFTAEDWRTKAGKTHGFYCSMREVDDRRETLGQGLPPIAWLAHAGKIADRMACRQQEGVAATIDVRDAVLQNLAFAHRAVDNLLPVERLDEPDADEKSAAVLYFSTYGITATARAVLLHARLMKEKKWIREKLFESWWLPTFLKHDSIGPGNCMVCEHHAKKRYEETERGLTDADSEWLRDVNVFASNFEGSTATPRGKELASQLGMKLKTMSSERAAVYLADAFYFLRGRKQSTAFSGLMTNIKCTCSAVATDEQKFEAARDAAGSLKSTAVEFQAVMYCAVKAALRGLPEAEGLKKLSDYMPYLKRRAVWFSDLTEKLALYRQRRHKAPVPRRSRSDSRNSGSLQPHSQHKGSGRLLQKTAATPQMRRHPTEQCLVSAQRRPVFYLPEDV